MTKQMSHLAQVESAAKGYDCIDGCPHVGAEWAMVTRAILGAVPPLYGLVHLLGFVVYWRLSEVKGLSYRTATLSGSHKAGGARAWVFGECLLFGEHRGSGGGATPCPGFKAATALH